MSYLQLSDAEWCDLHCLCCNLQTERTGKLPHVHNRKPLQGTAFQGGPLILHHLKIACSCCSGKGRFVHVPNRQVLVAADIYQELHNFKVTNPGCLNQWRSATLAKHLRISSTLWHLFTTVARPPSVHDRNSFLQRRITAHRLLHSTTIQGTHHQNCHPSAPDPAPWKFLASYSLPLNATPLSSADIAHKAKEERHPYTFPSAKQRSLKWATKAELYRNIIEEMPKKQGTRLRRVSRRDVSIGLGFMRSHNAQQEAKLCPRPRSRSYR